MPILYINGGIQVTIPVLYSDRWLVVCEKPVGVSSESPGLPNLLSAQLQGNFFPVHRLDQSTGGVCILARSAETCAALQQLFLQALVSKEYTAVISGRPDEDEGVFEDLLFHDRRINKTYIVKQKRGGVKAASCAWRVLDSVTSDGQILSLMRVTLHTGRTHQIRVQFASRGYPLVGDRRYGSRIKTGAPSLWARSISFPHPFAGNDVVSFCSSPPGVFPWNCFPKI